VRQRVFFTAVFVSIFLVAIASADTLRTVALTGQQAPGAAPGVIYDSFGAHYDSIFGAIFRGPVLNDAGQTAFRADLSGNGVGSTNNQGVWSEGSGSLALVARTGSQAPGAPSGVNFRVDPTLELFSPVLNNAGQSAFYGGLTDGNVGIWSEGAGGLNLVARSGVQAAGAPAGVNLSFAAGLDPFHLDWPKLNDAGQTAFVGALTGAGVTTTNNWGVWSNGSGSLELVARAGDQAPGTPSGMIYGVDNFASVAVGGLNGAGHIALWANLAGSGVVGNQNFGVWSGGSGSQTLVTRSGSHAPGTPSGVSFLHPLAGVASNNAGQIVFPGLLTGSGVNSTNDMGLWSNRSGSLELVARKGSQAAGTPSGVKYFNILAFPVLNDAGQITFGSTLTGSGVDSTNELGIWSDGSGEMALVARTGSQAPGTAAGVKFSNLNSLSLNSAGQTAFRAYLTGGGVDLTNDRGIWATDRDGALQLIVRTGEELEVAPGDFRTPSDLDFVSITGNGDSQKSGFNNLGQLVFWASFTDGSQGVFVSNAVAGRPGDFNNDLIVDAADYVLWRKNDGTQAGYDTWRANFGKSINVVGATGSTRLSSTSSDPELAEGSSPKSASVAAESLSSTIPEPYSIALAATAFGVFTWRGRTWRRVKIHTPGELLV
jgi:hypothetical protein